MELFTNQLLAVEKVLEEMKKTEEVLLSLGLNWSERLSDVYSEELFERCYEVTEKYSSRYDLSNGFRDYNSIGIPLIRENVVLENYLGKKIPFDCVFGKVDWYDIKSRRATRKISFSNNGDITVWKDSKLSSKRPLFYKAKYNVLDENDFQLNGYYELFNTDRFTFSLIDNVLTEKIQNVEIVRNLNNGEKTIKIEKDDLLFTAVLNSDDSFKCANLDIITKKGNGKINGIYRFALGGINGLDATFYSRKGKKYDLTYNSELLEKAYELLKERLSEKCEANDIISYYLDAIHTAIDEKFPPEDITFAVDLYTIKKLESKMKNIFNDIKGEIPVPELATRIERALYLIYDYNKDDYHSYLLKKRKVQD